MLTCGWLDPKDKFQSIFSSDMAVVLNENSVENYIDVYSF